MFLIAIQKRNYEEYSRIQGELCKNEIEAEYIIQDIKKIKLTQDRQEKEIEGLKIANLELNKQIKSLMDKQDNDKIENNKKMLNISEKVNIVFLEQSMLANKKKKASKATKNKQLKRRDQKKDEEEDLEDEVDVDDYQNNIHNYFILILYFMKS